MVDAADVKEDKMEKFTKIVTYADDMVFITRNRRGLVDPFQSLAKETEIRGPMINESKTKYMMCARKATKNTKQIKIEEQMDEKAVNEKGKR